MKELKFRNLNASEIECRIAMVKEKGISLLLYKDARVDQNILDETVGPLNWQRHHSRDNANCTVAIWDEEKNQWIEKEDTGKESYTEAEKGLASDSFKRACFNWGIGRELYTAPFIWINNGAGCTVTNGKCFDKYQVAEIDTVEGNISALTIIDSKGNAVFSYGKGKKKTDEAPVQETKAKAIDKIKVKAIEAKIAKKGLNESSIIQHYKVAKLSDLNFGQWKDAMELLDKYKDKE